MLRKLAEAFRSVYLFSRRCLWVSSTGKLWRDVGLMIVVLPFAFAYFMEMQKELAMIQAGSTIWPNIVDSKVYWYVYPSIVTKLHSYTSYCHLGRLVCLFLGWEKLRGWWGSVFVACLEKYNLYFKHCESYIITKRLIESDVRTTLYQVQKILWKPSESEHVLRLLQVTLHQHRNHQMTDKVIT